MSFNMVIWIIFITDNPLSACWGCPLWVRSLIWFSVLLWWLHCSNIVSGPCFNTLRPRQNGRRFADDTFKRIFLNENVRISIKISLNCVSKGPINNNPALVQIMAWRRPGDKPLSEPMMVSLLTHILGLNELTRSDPDFRWREEWHQSLNSLLTLSIRASGSNWCACSLSTYRKLRPSYNRISKQGTVCYLEI